MERMSSYFSHTLPVNNLEYCPNFEHFFEICCNSDYKKLKQFKEKHSREGEFTDEEGGIVAATAFTLGVTIRNYSGSSSKQHFFLDHNPNQPTTFHIFHNQRIKNSEHFQSLKQPSKPSSKKENRKRTNIFENLDTSDASDTSDAQEPIDSTAISNHQEPTKATTPATITKMDDTETATNHNKPLSWDKEHKTNQQNVNPPDINKNKINNYCPLWDTILINEETCEYCDNDEDLSSISRTIDRSCLVSFVGWPSVYLGGRVKIKQSGNGFGQSRSTSTQNFGLLAKKLSKLWSI